MCYFFKIKSDAIYHARLYAMMQSTRVSSHDRRHSLYSSRNSCFLSLVSASFALL